MRKIHFLIMLCLPLCLSIQAKAEPEGMLPAEKAEMKAGKMKEAQAAGNWEQAMELMKELTRLNDIKAVLSKELGERIILKM